MTFTVGGVDVTAVHVGSTPAVAVYAGDVKVWPSVAPIAPAYSWKRGDYDTDWQKPGWAGVGALKYLRLNPVDASGVDRSGEFPTDWTPVPGGGAIHLYTLDGALLEEWTGGSEWIYSASTHRIVIRIGLPRDVQQLPYGDLFVVVPPGVAP